MVGGQLADADQPHVGVLVEHRDERAKGPLDDFGVRVQEQDVAGVGGLQAPVVAVPEAAVRGVHHACPGEAGLDKLAGPVGRFVVDHDDVEDCPAAWAKTVERQSFSHLASLVETTMIARSATARRSCPGLAL